MESEDSLNSSFYEEQEEQDENENVERSCPSKRQRGRKEKSATAKPPLAICHKCNSRYYSLDGYKNHVGMHFFEELLLLAPSKEEFQDTSVNCSIEVLKEMQSKPVSGGKGPEALQLLNELLNPEPTFESDVKHFLHVTADEIWKCFPSPKPMLTSAFHSSFVAAIILLLSKKREPLMESLEKFSKLRRAVLDCFLCDFVNKLSIRVEAAFISAIKTPHLSNVYSKSAAEERDDLDDCEIQQTIHYVGGASVKSVLAMATRATKSEHWQRIARAIQQRILVGELVDAPDEVLCEWTRSRNRGALKFIGKDMLTFFIALSEILKELEKEDGSLLHSEVSEKVQSSYVMSLLWDEILKDALVDSESKLLKSELIVSFTNTWGKGIAYRRQNAIVNLGDSVPLRSQLSKPQKAN